MTAIDAYITLARHYCHENFSYWSDRYTKERTGEDYPYTYTDNDYNLFPRYNVISAILQGILKLQNVKFADAESCKQKLVEIGRQAQSVFTTGEQNEIEQKAMQEEREKFVAYIENLKAADLAAVDPLPYQRRLKEDEIVALRNKLLEKWLFDGEYWYPLVDVNPGRMVFIRKENFTESDYHMIIDFIRMHACELIYELDEAGDDEEIEFSLFHPDCYETVYVDEKMEWIVYGSHESTITFGGEVLVSFIEELFSTRKEKLNSWEVS